MKGSAADVIVKYLEQEGVEYLFGVPGGHLLSLYDAVHRAGTVKTILAKNEQGAGYMANGYAQVSGRLAVCCGTVGPGATNMVSGAAAAYMDSVPVLFLTGQVGTTTIGKGALQEGAGEGRSINQVALYRSVTKFSTMVTRSSSLPEILRKAIRIALSGRPGPVHLDIPADVLKGQVEDPVLPPTRYRVAQMASVDPSLLDRASEILSQADRPAMLIGAGAISAQAQEEVLALAEKLQIPVATSLRGKGVIPEDHSLALGCLGLYGTKAANSYLRSGIDVLLAVGVSFHEFTTHCWDPAFQPKTALIQVDIDPTEIGKNYPVDVALVGDAKLVLKGLISAVAKLPAKATTSAEELARFKASNEYLDEPAMRATDFPLKPQRAVVELREALPIETIVFTDIGNSLTWAERFFPVQPPGKMISLSGLAAMGSGTAAVIGGKLAAPSQPVVCICGDGDFQMTGMEVSTAVSHGIPVVWVILENSRLGMVYDVQLLMYKGRIEASGFHKPDFAALAHALGADGYRISKPGELGEIVASAIRSGKPSVIEVPIDANELPPMKPRMLAIERSMGLPKATDNFSWRGFKALISMAKER